MDSSSRKLGVFTLGCRLNQHESDSLIGKFIQQGFSLEKNPDSPVHVCILNTCAVTARGEQKSRQALSRMRKRHPDAIIIVTGCAVENNQAQFPQDEKVIFVDNDRKHAIAEIAERALAAAGSHSAFIAGIAPNRFAFAPAEACLHTRASLKVEDGCDGECSYCLVPRVRGKTQSRPLEDCLEAARATLALGYHEIVVTGVNIRQYRDPESGQGLETLIQSLIELEGDFRLRLSSIEPECDSEKCGSIPWFQNTQGAPPPATRSRLEREARGRLPCTRQVRPQSAGASLRRGMDAATSAQGNVHPGGLPPPSVTGNGSSPAPTIEIPNMDAMARLFENERLCPHLHLCLQSGSDAILGRMRRRYRAKDFLRLCTNLRQARSLFNLTADVIVGFPGESDEDFACTLDLVRQCGFTHAHAFPFSPRPECAAAEFPDRPRKNTVGARMLELRRVVQENRNAFLQSLIGIQERVLVEKIHANGNASGYGGLYIPIRVQTSLDQNAGVNTFVDCVITDVDPEGRGLIARPQSGI